MQMAPRHELQKNNRFPRTIPGLLIAVAVILTAWALAALLAIQPPLRATAPTAGESLTEAAVPPAEVAVAPATDPPLAVPEAVPASVPATEPPAAEAAVAEPPPEKPVGGVPDRNLYVVVAGDTVGAIAARFGLNVYDVLAANGLGVYSTIMPGQTLKLSGPPVSAAPLAPAPPAKASPARPAPGAQAVRTIFVAGSGGQAMVDRCIGPIHFTPTDAYSLFITEHDFCGGWARFSGIGVGETVILSGYGTYKATGRGHVFRGGTANDVRAVFGGFPRAVLQTCIPGSNKMLLIALN